MGLRTFTTMGELLWYSVQFISVEQSCLTLCDHMDCSMPGFPVHQQLPELAHTHVHWVGDTIQSSHSLPSPSPAVPSIFPSIRVFFNEPVIHIRWPKSNEYSWLISFMIDWFALLAVSRVFSNTTVQNHQFMCTQLSLRSNSHTQTWLRKNHSFD